MIEAHCLHVSSRDRAIVRDVSFNVGAGQLVGLAGPNGAGKTTLLKAIAGILRSDGQLTLAGQNASGMAAPERARHIAYLPQTRPLAWDLPAEDVVALGRFSAGAGAYHTMASGERAAVIAAMAKADAGHLAGRSFRSLSGGEQARLHIARLLCSPAPILLLDEPCAALDIAHQLSLMDILRTEAAAGRTIMVVMHDLQLAERFCPRLMVMRDGLLVADGAASAILSPSCLQTVFGVRRSDAGWFVPAG